jgi:hypothetical protein
MHMTVDFKYPFFGMSMMNFDSGVAGDFTLNILQHLVKKESVCDNLHNRYEDVGVRCVRKSWMQGDLPEERFSKSIALDEEVLALREAKEQEKVDKRDQVVKNAINEFTKRTKE